MNSNILNLNSSYSPWTTRDNRSPILASKIYSYTKSLFKKKLIEVDFNENFSQAPIYSSHPEVPKIEKFKECLVDTRLLKNLRKCGIANPTPVQKYTIPAFLIRKDILACSQTGSGKTACYLFTVIAKMLMDGPPPTMKRPNCSPLALILVPTHELANQVYEESLKLTYKTGIRVVTVSGGIPIVTQQQELYHGSDIIIATPSRLIDFVERGLIDLSITRYLIIDEADIMLNSGFKPQILRVLQNIKKLDRETFMCSASLPNEIEAISSLYLNELVKIFVGSPGTVNKNIQQIVHLVQENQKFQVLFDILISRPGQKLVFVNTRGTADKLKFKLSKENIECLSLHGGKTKNERKNALLSFKEETVSVLIATNLASRGLDFPNISCVLFYDVPLSIQIYIHAIGRTGRLGNKGVTELLIFDKPCGVYAGILKIMENSYQSVPEWFRNLASGSYQLSQGSYYVENQNLIYNKKAHNKNIFKDDEGLIGPEIQNSRFFVEQFHNFNSKQFNLKNKQGVSEFKTEIINFEFRKNHSCISFVNERSSLNKKQSLLQESVTTKTKGKKVEYTLKKVSLTTFNASQSYSLLLDDSPDNNVGQINPETDPWQSMNPALVDLVLE